MAPRKSNKGLITNKKEERFRTKDFLKSKAAIMKKARELSILCGVQVGVIIFGPNQDPTPHVWPQNDHEIHSIIGRYQNTSSDKRREKALEMSDFMVKGNCEEQIDEIVEKPKMLAWGWVDQIDSFSMNELIDLSGCLDSKLGMVEARLGMMKRGLNEINYVQHDEKQKMMDMEDIFLTQELYSDQFLDDTEVGKLVMLTSGGDGGMMKSGQNLVEIDNHQLCEEQNMKRMLAMPLNNEYFVDQFLDGTEMVEPVVLDGGGLLNLMNDNVGGCSGVMRMQEAQNHSRLAPWERMLMGL